MSASSLTISSSGAKRITPRYFAGNAQSRSDAVLDAKLVRRFRAGEESAFVEMMNRHQRRIFGVVLAFIRNRADAEEITQDTFVCAHRGLARFRGDCSLATWLHRIAINRARNRYWYNHRRRHITRSLDAGLEAESKTTLAEIIPSDLPDPSQDLACRECSFLIATCMEKLPPPQREILTLRTILNRSYAEIAEALEIDVGTVKSRIARARERLRARVKVLCPELCGTDTAAACNHAVVEGGRAAVA